MAARLLPLHQSFNPLGIDKIIVLLSVQFLGTKDKEGNSLFDDLQSSLSTHAGEMAIFARELRQVGVN